MASSGKKKTTMAKLQREGRMREKRQDKQARKVERRRNAANGITTYADLDVDAFGNPIAESDDVETETETETEADGDAVQAEASEATSSDRSGS